MLVHPNPMVRVESGQWIDTHLKRVEVRPIRVNWGNHRQRWVVYARPPRGKTLLLISRHITEEQAVVTAQTLANRYWRKDQKHHPRSKKLASSPLTITKPQLNDFKQRLQRAWDHAYHPEEKEAAQDLVKKLITDLRQSFQLNK